MEVELPARHQLKSWTVLTTGTVSLDELWPGVHLGRAVGRVEPC
ncbi:hypothetical protein [Tenggerimyces flavus]|uniref:Uncharacterized protein n=1 Tax=Tenggerimyces flavus TaxID=1708749 RepID=A0ABV7YRR8_9ACTN|nr:hypothetical protein [Tenggerimyces flavus]MBM7786511.1 hypothetical protein [Tenggerimyces flavus]